MEGAYEALDIYDAAASVMIVAASFSFREVARDGMLFEKRKRTLDVFQQKVS
jgi:hypothetical protein